MIQIGTQVVYQGEIYTISNAREFRVGQYIYTLKSAQGKIINSYESNFRVIQSNTLIEKVANNDYFIKNVFEIHALYSTIKHLLHGTCALYG